MHGRFMRLEFLPAFEAAIAEEIERGSWTSRRDALGVALGLHGLRVSEVSRLRRKDLFVPAQRLYVETLKGGRPRELSLHDSMVAALLDWHAGASCPWLLFTRPGRRVHPSQFRRAARRLTHRVVGEPLRFHSLRHTFAQRVYFQTPDWSLVQRLLGHRSIRSTEVYVQSLLEQPDSSLVRLDAPAPPVTERPQLRIFNAG